MCWRGDDKSVEYGAAVRAAQEVYARSSQLVADGACGPAS